MKKIFLYALSCLLAGGLFSCKDDEVLGVVNPAEDFDRMPMTMFRLNENTGKGEEDPYGMRVITEDLNTVELVWYGIKGCAGYEIKYGNQNNLQSGKTEDWNNPDNITEIIRIDDPEQLSIRIKNLDYATAYRFAIRVLNPDGIEEHHSKWYGLGDGREWAEQAGLTTLERYNTPGVINVGNISDDRTEFTVYMNINVKDAVEGFCGSGASEQEKIQCFEDFKKNFELEPEGADDYTTARFKVTGLTVDPSYETPNASVDEKWRNHPLNKTDFDENGTAEFRVTGLQENAVYVCNVVNSNIPVIVDARYNAVRKAVYGDPGAPILIKHQVRDYDSIPGETAYQACLLDKVIGDFGNDISLAEGQVFYLEGDKAYFFFNSPAVVKGFTLATRPSDVAQGKRAKVYLGGIGHGLDSDGNETASLQTNNFSYGRLKKGNEADCPIEIGEVVFRDIDFDCPLAVNGGDPGYQGGGTGNYFANCVDGGMALTVKAWKIQNCTFRNIQRGFCRVKSSKSVIFDHFLVENCVFYDGGFYGTTKAGYAFVSDGQTKLHNMYKKMEIVNNTLYNFVSTDLVGKDGAHKVSDYTGVAWNIRVDGNTFINFGTDGKGPHYIFNNQRYPDNLHFSCRNNLFVMTAKDDDTARPLQCRANDLRTAYETGLGQDIEVDIRNNFFMSSRPEYDVADKIFNNNQFGNSKNSFGAINYNGDDIRLVNTTDDLKVLPVKVGDNYLRPAELFSNPNVNTIYNASSATHDMWSAPGEIWSVLKYKTVPAELNGIGDPRWASSDPKKFYLPEQDNESEYIVVYPLNR